MLSTCAGQPISAGSPSHSAPPPTACIPRDVLEDSPEKPFCQKALGADLGGGGGGTLKSTAPPLAGMEVLPLVPGGVKMAPLLIDNNDDNMIFYYYYLFDRFTL